jgi:uncharacterized protein YqjF (DUF2071 family)
MPATTGIFLTAQWRYLVMLNYEVDPGVLAPYVPAGTVLDLWQGRSLVSLVGFQFLDTRVLGWTIPGHRHFTEVNLRFYVRREVGGETRRGVVFIKEIVPRRAIAWVARRVYGENYVALPMRAEVFIPPSSKPITGGAAYAWRFKGRWHSLGAEIVGAPWPAIEGSEEQFITEHYWGYARRPDGGTAEYQVEHPRWNIWRAKAPRAEIDIAGLYGAEFADALACPPCSAFVADGSAIVVHRGRRLV